MNDWEQLLLEWHNNMPEVTPPMSIRKQAELLSKKHPIETHTITQNIYNQNTEQAEPTQVEKVLMCFKNVICKYRPHLHLGEYWLDLTITDGIPNYKFYQVLKIEEDNPLIIDAVHPHLSNGIPCLGNFQGDLGAALQNGNYIQFCSIMKSYLQSYNSRSTYMRGAYFKTSTLYCQLHSYEQIREVFEGHEVDTNSVGTDPTRWNWPKNMTPLTKIELTGQDCMSIYSYFNNKDFPFLTTARRHHSSSYSDNLTNKILGYVSIAMVVGELSLYQAFEFVRIFLITLLAQYEGNMDQALKTKLSALSRKIYDCGSGTLRLNPRYRISLPTEDRDTIAELMSTVRPYQNEGHNSMVQFVEQLKYAGIHFSNFMILLRKRSPHKARASTYLYSTIDGVDIDDIELKYNKIRKSATHLALQQLEKDKRSFINEINRPEINNIVTDDGQGSLFSQNL